MWCLGLIHLFLGSFLKAADYKSNKNIADCSHWMLRVGLTHQWCSPILPAHVSVLRWKSRAGVMMMRQVSWTNLSSHKAPTNYLVGTFETSELSMIILVKRDVIALEEVFLPFVFLCCWRHAVNAVVVVQCWLRVCRCCFASMRATNVKQGHNIKIPACCSLPVERFTSEVCF